MVDELKIGEGDLRIHFATSYPVTRVYCDGNGIICYERLDYEPIRLNELSPSRSRVDALERLVGLLDMVDELTFERSLPISNTGFGLTYNQLKEQTAEACKQSKVLEAKLSGIAADKKSKRRSK